MRRVLTVAVAAAAAAATRLPDPALGVAALLLGGAWTAATWWSRRRERIHLLAPAPAIALVALPLPQQPLLDAPSWSVGLAVATAVLAALPRRGEASTTWRSWLPAILVAATLWVGLYLPRWTGPHRIASIWDLQAPGVILPAVLLLAAVAAAKTLLLDREATP